jgi:glucosyl-3-phosphoglycerate synthase
VSAQTSKTRRFALADLPLVDLVARKRALGLTVAVIIPCRNEAATVGTMLSQITASLYSGGFNAESAEMGPVRIKESLVDELIVMDDNSIDQTAAVASAAGARVVRVGDVLCAQGPGVGKGNALWASVEVAKSDVIVWCDGDLVSFTPDYVRRLVAPFVVDPNVAMVKGYYERPLDAGGSGGGRNTELVARPMFRLLFPELADITQPLAGEYAIRRSVARQVPFAQGYGVEAGLLIDVAALLGASAVGEVDLGVRRHRHRTLEELGRQSAEVMHAILLRAGVAPARISGVLPLDRPPLDSL